MKLLWVIVLLVAVVWLAVCACGGAPPRRRVGGAQSIDDCVSFWTDIAKIALPDRVITEADTAAFHKLCRSEALWHEHHRHDKRDADDVRRMRRDLLIGRPHS